MLGKLPTSLLVKGRNLPIRSDFRSVLQIIEAYNDPNLKDWEKAKVCLVRMFPDFNEIPQDLYGEAYKAATTFIEGGLQNGNGRHPKTVNWTKDEFLIFPEINKVAGYEVRGVPYLHWWTFLGYFQAVDRDGIWGMVLTIRHKKAIGKKLEDYEKEFYQANQQMCMVDDVQDISPEKTMEAIFADLLEGGDK